MRWKIEPQDLFLRQTYPVQTARMSAIKNALRPQVRKTMTECLQAIGIESMAQALEELRSLRFLKALGYDGGEERRATMSEDVFCRLWFPLIELDMDRDACLKKIDEHGLPRPPKSACFYCPSSKKSEVLALAKEHPDLFARAVEMERRADESGKSTSVKGLGRNWSWTELVTLDPKRQSQIPERPVESCVMCADGSVDDE